ncbi:UNVERIFIED_CONTAM: hypothetical protein Slati_4247000 [Sesamum latifolium]|uniref:Retrotransposon gag protein n=1 Tax=Sesamum latifolium TaxID=2727402 RepID=A0AAW2TB82_9LAMI
MNDPKYCKYHQVISHPIGRCFMVKEKIIALAKERKIILDIEETASTNVTNITLIKSMNILEEKLKVMPSSITTLSALQFGSFKPTQIEALFVKKEKEIPIEDDDGWILMTH